MGDEPPPPIHHIGVAALADLQRRDDVPDQLQIDLGDSDAGVAAVARHCQCHIRLGFLAEIDRAEPDAVCLGFDEGRALREIRLAADRVHRQARHFELLLALAVELREFGDRRHLTPQANIILAALVERPRRPLRMRGPADLALDLLDKLCDALRRRCRLLLLHPDEGRLGLLVGEPEIEAAIDQERRADQRDKDQRIFAEQAAPRRGTRRLAEPGPSGRRRRCLLGACHPCLVLTF